MPIVPIELSGDVLTLDGATVVLVNWLDGSSLLPSNSTAFERAVEAAGFRLDVMDIDFRQLWDPETCPLGLLPWLAWTLSVDEWDADWSEDQKRAVVAASVDVHWHKGTVWSIRRALIAAGYGDAEIIERFGNAAYDGTILHDGSENHTDPDHWAEYRLRLARPISIKQAAQVRAILSATQPAHCHLKALDFTEALNLYDAKVSYDGLFTHGVA